MSSSEYSPAVPIALLYAAQNAPPALIETLADLGVQVVYAADAASFRRSALTASGAQVVLVNLEPEAEAEIDVVDELLADRHLSVVFDDSEVSTRLQGWERARWARHLAAKLRGASEVQPPRPPGAPRIEVATAAIADPAVSGPSHNNQALPAAAVASPPPSTGGGSAAEKLQTGKDLPADRLTPALGEAPVVPVSSGVGATASVDPPSEEFRVALGALRLAPLNDALDTAPRGSERQLPPSVQASPAPPADRDQRPQVVSPPATPTTARRVAMEDFDFSGLSLLPLDDSQPADLARAEHTAPVQPAAPQASVAVSSEAKQATRAAHADVRNVWVLAGSIGGPDAVREFLAAVPADIPAVFLLAQHHGEDFLELMVQQLARSTTMPIRTVADGNSANHGEVIVVPLVDRLLLGPDGAIHVRPAATATPFRPSIDRVLHDVADRFGAAAGVIVFSGMTDDAVEGATYLYRQGGRVWVQDPATCVMSTMVEGVQRAGIVSFVGSPSELATALAAKLSKDATVPSAMRHLP